MASSLLFWWKPGSLIVLCAYETSIKAVLENLYPAVL